MSNEIMKFSEWEAELGLIFVGDLTKTSKSLSKKLTKEEFKQERRTRPEDFVGVDHKERIEFLERNGYEVTRENMINGELPTVNPPEPEEDEEEIPEFRGELAEPESEK